MDYIETDYVISDVYVSERKKLSVLQRHLKVKFNGKQVFKKIRTLENSRNA